MPSRSFSLMLQPAWLLAAVILLVIAASVTTARAEQAVVTTVDGNQMEGELVSQNNDEVVLSISGIQMSIPRERIESIEIQPSIEEVYRERRAELEDDDLDGRYDLAYDLYQQNALDLALRELNDMVERFPDSERVARLQRVVQQRKQMLEERQVDERPDRSRPDRPAQADSRASVPADRLTPAQINRIRVYEIELGEEPRVQIPNPVLEQFLQKYADDSRVPATRDGQAAFKRAEGYRQLELMFNVQAREFYGDAIVRQDPPALRTFRTRMHSQYVLGYCGTNQCHGGEDAPGGLRLVRALPARTETVYTNFYLLSEYENEQGLMIERGRPTRSLLLQYGLPRNVAETPHPDVPRWSPHFTGVDDRFYREYATIIDSLWAPKPDYGIDFRPSWQPEEETSQRGRGGMPGNGDADNTPNGNAPAGGGK